jgi:hypothetical protein
MTEADTEASTIKLTMIWRDERTKIRNLCIFVSRF